MRDARSRLKVGEIVREYVTAIERARSMAYLRSVIIRRDSASQYRVQIICHGITEADHGTWRSEEDTQDVARAVIMGRREEH